jgi:hypothetical protein
MVCGLILNDMLNKISNFGGEVSIDGISAM